MKRLIFVLLFFSCAICMAARVDLTRLPQMQRDSALVAIVQNVLLHKFPDRYHKNVYPVISEYRIDLEVSAWLQRGEMQRRYRYPHGVETGDIGYSVQFYYKNKQGKEADESVSAEIIGKTGEVWMLSLQSGDIVAHYGWERLAQIADASRNKKGLWGMPASQRDSLLGDIARKAVKTYWPALYRENLHPNVVQGDFSAVRLRWKKQEEGLPDYVLPNDVLYMVYLYYEDWKKERYLFPRPYVAIVYIVGKNQKAYLIKSGAMEGERCRCLL